jgi:hypothetical protein
VAEIADQTVVVVLAACQLLFFEEGSSKRSPCTDQTGDRMPEKCGAGKKDAETRDRTRDLMINDI